MYTIYTTIKNKRINRMKKILPVVMFVFYLSGISSAQTMEIHSGEGKGVYYLADVDSIIFDVPYDTTGTVTDIDGYVYKTVKIGDQWWMAENLRVTRYRNDDTIPNVTNSLAWFELSSGAYCNYDNDTTYVATYGRLYNWYAVDDSRNIAPEGWHVPSDEEWKELEMYLGMSRSEADRAASNDPRGTDEGGKLKEAGTTHWQSPNTGATNSSGFTALPGGNRGIAFGFFYMGFNAIFWTSTQYDSDRAWIRSLQSKISTVYNWHEQKYNGFSIRCVRD